MYVFEGMEPNLYVRSQISSPLKEGEEISLSGDVSIQLALHSFVFFFPCMYRS